MVTVLGGMFIVSLWLLIVMAFEVEDNWVDDLLSDPGRPPSLKQWSE